MSYESTLAYINSPKWQRSKPGLERTQHLLRCLGNPEKQLKFVHVAGTNGKGSTAACVAAVLQQAGYRTGLYISPYIIRFSERIQIDGEYIPDDELERVVDLVRPYADAMEDVPTEFEVVTAIAMKYFADNRADIVVLEVGLGGELDATNVIDTPEVAVITAIGLDHTAMLGDTLPKIASAKAGIIKSGGLVCTYPADDDVNAVFENKCREVGAELTKTDMSDLSVKDVELDGCTFDFGGLKDVFVPLAGTYQPMNAAVAITACRLLASRGWRINDDDIVRGLAKVKWPGRFEVLMKHPVFILDGSHNPHGIRATVESMKKHFGDRKITFVMGVMADKDVDHMVEMIAPLADRVYTARPENSRAMDPMELALRFQLEGIISLPCPSIQRAVDEAVAHAGPDGVVVAIGSLYFSNDIRQAAMKHVSE
ncbi:MAG: bifunctional folylpolyglutamate synthase/dihydrofolate synthase [Oscillospiraceae bacterium]|nr:bifunctional folylpolyglutamate synthase/dihydrofolate synthase [Oscillospiraceae bacterium]